MTQKSHSSDKHEAGIIETGHQKPRSVPQFITSGVIRDYSQQKVTYALNWKKRTLGPSTAQGKGR